MRSAGLNESIMFQNHHKLIMQYLPGRDHLAVSAVSRSMQQSVGQHLQGSGDLGVMYRRLYAIKDRLVQISEAPERMRLMDQRLMPAAKVFKYFSFMLLSLVGSLLYSNDIASFTTLFVPFVVLGVLVELRVEPIFERYKQLEYLSQGYCGVLQNNAARALTMLWHSSDHVAENGQRYFIQDDCINRTVTLGSPAQASVVEVVDLIDEGMDEVAEEAAAPRM